ncbi:hypothetical protein [Bradyrhizobium sp. WSM1743]|uniref:hypothetical protein n=1 Tax=Bradyrhizobium sp. WSM1743 TaxID=318996 RepID=UPI00352797DF
MPTTGATSARQRPALALNVRGSPSDISSIRIGCNRCGSQETPDVGGSYPENEARLSDIPLSWMAHAAESFPDGKTPDGFGIKVDDTFLKLTPDPLGP